jgi:hypothetical protein
MSCKEKAALSAVVTKAVDGVCKAKADYNRAIREFGPAVSLLARAQLEERRAVAALDRHKEAHGCLSATKTMTCHKPKTKDLAKPDERRAGSDKSQIKSGTRV